MTRVQESIVKYINQNLIKIKGDMSIALVEDSAVKLTDKNGESMTLTMNLFGDIMDADTKQIYAVSNLPHDWKKIGTLMPHSWVAVDPQ